MSGLGLPAFAVTFAGTITETVTATDSPDYFVGQTVIGSYRYESPTIDGDFGTGFYAAFNPSALPTLRGSIFAFIGDPSWLEITDSSFSFLTHLTVSGGVVTDFHQEGQRGAADYFLSESSFGSRYDASLLIPSVRTSGTMSFSDPVAVPESSSVAAGAVGVLLLAVTLRHRQRKTKTSLSAANGDS